MSNNLLSSYNMVHVHNMVLWLVAFTVIIGWIVTLKLMVKFVISPTTLFKLETQIFTWESLPSWETNVPQGLISLWHIFSINVIFQVNFSSHESNGSGTLFYILWLKVFNSQHTIFCESLRWPVASNHWKEVQTNFAIARFCYVTHVHSFAWSILRLYDFNFLDVLIHGSYCLIAFLSRNWLSLQLIHNKSSRLKKGEDNTLQQFQREIFVFPNCHGCSMVFVIAVVQVLWFCRHIWKLAVFIPLSVSVQRIRSLFMESKEPFELHNEIPESC